MHLKLHHFVSKEPAKYLPELKANIKEDEAIALMDFAENYSFIVQDAPQSYHRVNTQATLHPIVIYFRSRENRADISVKSFVVISDYLEHNTVAVWSFQKEVLKKLKNDLPEVTRIHYFSDGAASEYKNKKNVMNLCYHENNFNLSAEWNFFATSHGKGACDGVGTTVKRLAARASIQRPYKDQILTRYELFAWAEKNIKRVVAVWVPQEIIEENEADLTRRFARALPLKGIRGFHHIKPLSLSTVHAGLTSY